MKKHLNRLGVLAVTLIIAMALIPSVAAYATAGTPNADAQAAGAPADAVGGTLSIEYRYAEGETPDIPEEVSQFGFVYHLVSVSDPVLEGSLPTTRTYRYKVGGSLTDDQLEQARKLGDITLSPVYIVKEREVDKLATLTVPTNDVDDIPMTMEFTVTSGTADGGTEVKTLDRAAVKFTRLNTDAIGRPGDYSADVTYRGLETYAELDYYVAEATFTTTVTEGGPAIYVVVAQYETDMPEVAPPVDEVTPEEEPTDVEAAIEPEDVPRGPYLGPFPVGSIFMEDARSLLSLIFAVIAVIILIRLALDLIRLRKSKDDIINEQYGGKPRSRSGSKMAWASAGICGALTLIICLIFDDPLLDLVWVNRWTIFVGIPFVPSVGLFMLYRSLRTQEGRDDLEEDNSEDLDAPLDAGK